LELIAKRQKPIVYVEGVRIPARRVVCDFATNGKALFQITLPPDPRWSSKTIIQAADGSAVDEESGLPIRATYELAGLQPKTIFHIFVSDEATGETTFLGEARLKHFELVTSQDGTSPTIVAVGSAYFMQEVAMYMVETSRGLEMSGEDWGSRAGTTQTSSVVSKLKSEGLAKGILALLKDAGLNSNQACNLTWKLLNLDHRIVVQDNSKAMGYFDQTKLGTMLDKAIGATSSREPIASIIMYVMDLIRYITLNVPAPSFINAQYSNLESADATAVNELTMSIPVGTGSLEISNTEDLILNDLVFMPQIPFAPPPRCNVIFPSQYDTMTLADAPDNRPTRGIGRIAGSGVLSESYNANAIYMPEDFRAGLQAHGKQYVTPEECYRGVIMGALSYNRPEYIKDMGSDYVKAYTTQSYIAQMAASRMISVGGGSKGCPLNLKPVPGFPVAVLARNGLHCLGYLESIRHVLDIDAGCYTFYSSITHARPYTDPTPDYAGDLWFDDMYKPENIGAYVYPSLLGRYITTLDTINTELQDDMSILKHLFSNPEMTDDEVKTAKQDEKAIQNALDALWSEYSVSPYPEIYTYNYGRRINQGVRQVLEDFMGSDLSSDEFIARGGYTMKTNSVTLRNTEESGLEIGATIPDGSRLAGCFCKERQECYEEIAANLHFGINVARGPAEALDLLVPIVTEEAAASLMALDADLTVGGI